MTRCVVFTVTIAIVAALAGCSGKPTTYPVKGTVKFPDGSPMKGGAIYFSAPEMKVSARGDIADDGTFSLSTYEPGDGAPPGKYRVYVKQAGPQDSATKMERTVDQRYESDATSGLEATIAEGPNEVAIEVKPPK